MYTRTLNALAAGLAFLYVTGASAQETMTLAHWVPASHPLQVLGMEPWAKSLSEATQGRIKIEIFPAQQLGAAADHYDMARDGIADIGFINPGYQPGRFPIMAAAELPFHFANAKAGVRALTEWYKPYAEKEMADVYFCMALSHHPGTIHGRDRVLVPEDLRGKKVRPANATEGRFVNLLGGASVQVSAPESRELLANGGADATQSPWESLYIFGVDSFVKHHLDIPLYASINAFVINKGKLASLSAEDRKAVEDHCTPEWAEKMSSGWADVEAGGRDKIAADSTHTLHKPDAAQLQLWKDAAAPLTTEWKATVSKMGLDADAIYNGLVEALKKYDSFAG